MIKQYLHDGFIQLAIVLSLLRTDVNDYFNRNYISYPEVQDIVYGQSHVYSQTNFHNPLTGIDFYSYPLKNIDDNDISSLLRSLGHLRNPHTLTFPTEINAFLADYDISPFTLHNDASQQPVAHDNLPNIHDQFNSVTNSQQDNGSQTDLLSTNLTSEDMDLIEVLWHQDIDLGIGRDFFDAELRHELEREREAELHKQRFHDYELELLKYKKEEELSQDAQRWLAENYYQDGETGEYMSQSQDKNYISPSFSGFENEFTFDNAFEIIDRANSTPPPQEPLCGNYTEALSLNNQSTALSSVFPHNHETNMTVFNSFQTLPEEIKYNCTQNPQLNVYNNNTYPNYACFSPMSNISCGNSGIYGTLEPTHYNTPHANQITRVKTDTHQSHDEESQNTSLPPHVDHDLIPFTSTSNLSTSYQSLSGLITSTGMWYPHSILYNNVSVHPNTHQPPMRIVHDINQTLDNIQVPSLGNDNTCDAIASNSAHIEDDKVADVTIPWMLSPPGQQEPISDWMNIDDAWNDVLTSLDLYTAASQNNASSVPALWDNATNTLSMIPILAKCYDDPNDTVPILRANNGGYDNVTGVFPILPTIDGNFNNATDILHVLPTIDEGYGNNSDALSAIDEPFQNTNNAFTILSPIDGNYKISNIPSNAVDLDFVKDLDVLSNDSAISVTSYSPSSQMTEFPDWTHLNGDGPSEEIIGATGGGDYDSAQIECTSDNSALPRTYSVLEYFDNDVNTSATNSSTQSNYTRIPKSRCDILNHTVLSTELADNRYIPITNNHTYPLKPPSTIQPSKLPRKKKAGTSSKDRRKIKEQQLPYSPDHIVSCSVDEFNSIISHPTLNSSQKQLMRDIRRRGKNKVAAQNCRKRKVDEIVDLADDLSELQDQHDKLHREKEDLTQKNNDMEKMFDNLYSHVLTSLRDQYGTPHDFQKFTLVQDSNGEFIVKPVTNSSKQQVTKQPTKQKKSRYR